MKAEDAVKIRVKEEFPPNIDSIVDLIEHSKKEGRCEVVQWLVRNSWDGSLQHWGTTDYPVQCFILSILLAHLKEWGLQVDIEENTEGEGWLETASGGLEKP